MPQSDIYSTSASLSPEMTRMLLALALVLVVTAAFLIEEKLLERLLLLISPGGSRR